MLATINILHQADYYRITDFACHCETCSISAPEYNQHFSISFVRRGFFEYRSFRRSESMYAGRILVTKPGYEHRTRHIDQQPDLTTIFEFRSFFFEEIRDWCRFRRQGWFFNQADIHSLVLQSDPGIDYLYGWILDGLGNGTAGRLEMDEKVTELLVRVMERIECRTELDTPPEPFIGRHLATAERAKEYIGRNYNRDISLSELASYCYVSPFHFSRIFKSIFRISPHQYLSSVRLEHARHRLQSTSLPVMDIAFESGFNSVEHFVTSFKKKFGKRPGDFR